jgi:putative transposase
MLHVPKLKEDVELVVHRKLPDDAVIGSVTVSMDVTGVFYASIEYTCTVMMDMTLRRAALDGDESVLESLNILGLDYSQPDFYVDSEGRKANYPGHYHKAERKLARLQRELSHMVKGSSNYNKQLARIQKLHKKISNQRLDFVRKEAKKLADTYDVVAVEDINLRNMSQSLKLAKNLLDNGFGMFRDILAHKLETKGSVLVRVDRFFASTKTCSVCGYKNPEVVLGVGEWTCPSCGTRHLRDINAAVNIRNEGKRIFLDFFADWLAKKAKADERAARLSDARKNKKHIPQPAGTPGLG